jgi:hypothetical protein
MCRIMDIVVRTRWAKKRNAWDNCHCEHGIEPPGYDVTLSRSGNVREDPLHGPVLFMQGSHGALIAHNFLGHGGIKDVKLVMTMVECLGMHPSQPHVAVIVRTLPFRTLLQLATLSRSSRQCYLK